MIAFATAVTCVPACLGFRGYERAALDWERSAQESAERFAHFTAASFEGIAITEGGIIVDGNERLATLLGCDLGNLIGRPALAFVAPEHRDLVAAILRSGSEQPYSHLAQKGDGTIFPVNTHARSIPYKGGTARVTALRDITERVVAEEALRASEGRYRLLFEGNPLPMLVSDQETLRFVAANEAAVRQYGYSREELLELSVPDLAVRDEHLEQYLATRFEPRPDVLHVGLRQQLRKDGSVVDIDLTSLAILFGRRPARLALARDVTAERKGQAERDRLQAAIERASDERQRDRVRAEARLGEAEDRLERLASNAPVILWAVERDGTIGLAKGLGLAAFGVATTDIVGRPAHEKFADFPSALADLARVFSGESFVSTVKGRGRVLEMHYFPDRDSCGEVVRASGIALDITDRHRAQQELQASEDRFRQFADNLSEGVWMATRGSPEGPYVNPAYARILGLDPGDGNARRQDWRPTIHSDDRGRVWRHHGGLSAQPPGDETYRIVRPDGSVCWIRERRFATAGGGAVATHVAGLVEDMTEARRIESQARRIQDRLAEAQRLARVGTWEWEVATDESWASEETHRILGLPPRDAPMHVGGLLRAVHPEDQANVTEAFRRSQAEGNPLDVFHRILSADGTVRLVRHRGETTRDAQGHPIRMIGTLEDVTDSQETKKALAMLSSAVEQTADLVFITNAIGSFEYVNPAFEKHTGFSRDEAIGETPRILKSNETPGEAYEDLWKTILGGQSFRGVLANKKKDGKVFYEDKTITPIRDIQGKITHFLSVGRDITEKREVETAQRLLQDAVRQSANQWRATFDAVESPLVLATPQGTIRRLNLAAADLWGASYPSILGRSLSERSGEPWATMLRAVLATEASKASVSLPAEDATQGRTWGVTANPLRDKENEADVIVLAKDISAIVNLQTSLRRSQGMSAIGALVLGVAHEVRNPLFAISSTLDAFEARFGKREEYQQYLAVLREQLDRMSQFMWELLEYAKPAPLVLGTGRLQDVLAIALRSCAALAETSKVSLATDVRGTLPEVVMDRQRLAQVFQNLFDNAIRYSPSGATVVVRAELAEEGEGRWIVCQVLDSGPGFQPVDVPRLFEPFFTRRRGGTGLGLSIVQRIVEEHAGRITVRNRPDGGALVEVRLAAPREPAQAS